MDEENTLDHRQILHEWETPNFIPMPRGKQWYIAASIILALLIIFGLVTKNLTMIIAFIGVAVVFSLIEKKDPTIVKAQITDLGINYKDEFYPYHHINAFWIVYHPPYVQALYLRIRKKKRFQVFKIELNHENPALIRALLLKEIPEIEGAHEPIIDILTRILRLQ